MQHTKCSVSSETAQVKIKLSKIKLKYHMHAPSDLHLTTSTVMVWRLRGNIIRTVLYIANVLPFQWAQLTETVHTAWLGREFVFLCFLGCMICLYVGVCFVLPWSVESFPFMFWRWRNKLKWAPFELGAGSIPLRAIVNKKQCETRGYLCRWSSSTTE